LPLLVQTGDLVGHGEVFLLGRAIDHIGVLDAQHGTVRRDDDDLEFVDLVELRSLRLGSSGHA
jgi:hypothetical protein